MDEQRGKPAVLDPSAPHGNATTHNLESVLQQNIVNSRYYHGLQTHEFSDLVDEIYNEVSHVEPWMSGNARGPSTAFCILHALFEMKLDTRQMRTLLHHQDSPYIRAVGFLYLRYVADPRTLWSWFEEFLRDTEEIAPSPSGKTVPLGLFVRELLLDQFYFETIFPRIPEQVSRQIKDGLARLGFATAAVGCAGLGGSRRGGGDGRPPSVKAALSVSLGQRAPHVAGGREDGRGLTNVDPGRERRQREERERAERAGGGGAVREAPPPRRSPPRDAPRRSRSPPRRRSRSPERRRSRSRSREHRKHHSHKRRSRSRDRRDRSRSRERRRSRSRERRRSRSRERGGGDDGRSARDVFRAAPVPRTDVEALKDRY